MSVRNENQFTAYSKMPNISTTKKKSVKLISRSRIKLDNMAPSRKFNTISSGVICLSWAFILNIFRNTNAVAIAIANFIVIIP